MLGSATEADDAVQETWLRLTRSDADAVENLGGWLTTVVGRVCLNMLRTRKRRREEPLPSYASLDRAHPTSRSRLYYGPRYDGPGYGGSGYGGSGYDGSAYDGSDAAAAGWPHGTQHHGTGDSRVDSHGSRYADAGNSEASSHASGYGEAGSRESTHRGAGDNAAASRGSGYGVVGSGRSSYGVVGYGVGEFEGGPDPEAEALLADSVGVALLVVLETLNPAERLAFVLHDLFSVPFDEIAPIVGRTPTATRQLASRARRRVRGAAPEGERADAREREVVEAFLAAARGGDLDALVAVLDPDVVIRTADGTRHTGRELGGARVVARGAMSFLRSAESVYVALVDGTIGAVATTADRVVSVATFTITDNRITTLEIITTPDHLATLTLTPFPEQPYRPTR
jgi:RNA polymerase sigma factor (sigma-70 family)